MILIALGPGVTRGQSGTPYNVESSVTATGANVSGGSNSIAFTAGQPLAGPIQGGNFSIYQGFWTPPDVAPTAATVTVSGRVTSSSGQGVRNARITLTDSSGAARTALTASLGYYSFEDIRAGETYILSIRSKRFTFSVSTRVLTVTDTLSDVDFVAENQ